MLPDKSNHIFQLAAQFVNQTSRPIFLTGKAGTGKTTFLRYIRDNSFKKMAVVAPTGVAAINAGGVTMHSFFQLPFGPYLPVTHSGWGEQEPPFTDQHSLFKNIRFNAAKRELLQELELLVIDEVSMVRADALDAIDTILRHFRQQPLSPFGGLQVLYIGDLFQLPPVVSREEWELLKQHYKSPFFFDALALQESPPLYLELDKIYRQSEADFIGMLNNIRFNRTTREDLDRLHTYYRPTFQPGKGDHYITLTSHNAKADEINQFELSQLSGRQYSFEAVLTGEFQDKSFPADKNLQLKVGAQVMFIKNDKGESRRYFNGKIGLIKTLTADKILVSFPEEGGELTVEKETWKNIRYHYDKEKDHIEEEELGSFSQYPLRLAWAITIHKSQGLTFQKAIIDAGASFAAGQVYVALSRLTTIEGLVLRSRIHAQAITTDERILAFTESKLGQAALREQLQEEQKTFISRSLVQSFNWDRLVDILETHFQDAGSRQIPDKKTAYALARTLLDKAIGQRETAVKFSRQLEQLLATAAEDGYRQLQQRMEAAAAYFIRSLQDDLIDPLQKHLGDIKGAGKTKKYTKAMQELKTVFIRKKQQIEQSLQTVSGLAKGEDTGSLLSRMEEQKNIHSGHTRSAANAGTAGSDTANPVAPNPGTRTGPSAQGRPKKGDTHRVSLELYREGLSIADISIRRSLSKTTIESHLASFIFTGDIDVKDLVPEKKIAPILAALEKMEGTSINPVKRALGDQYSFGEIRAVLNYRSYMMQKNN
ncbi:MAG: helix-turn-helix domain-containing protein [Puia sp.]|nr:helix-turn-helix domain-containing protein [Puia sp.]